MLAVNFSTIRENLKSYCDKVTDEQETVIVTRKGEKNVVLISLEEWNALQKAARNGELFIHWTVPLSSCVLAVDVPMN